MNDATTSRARFVPAGGTVIVWIGAVVLVLVLLCVVLGDLIAPSDPTKQDLTLGIIPPAPGHPLGTDDLGRDVLSRTIAGARTAFIGPVIIVFGAVLLSNLFGLLAGFLGGKTDSVIMRAADFLWSLPALLVALVVAGILGGSFFVTVMLVTVLFVPYDTRIVRGAVLEQRSKPYVEAARTLGLPNHTIMRRHLWPNVAPFVVANAFLDFSYALVTLSALSFLGVGVGPGTADWGRMLAESRTLLFENPAAALGPGIMIVATAASMTIVGDWLYERYSDRGISR